MSKSKSKFNLSHRHYYILLACIVLLAMVMRSPIIGFGSVADKVATTLHLSSSMVGMISAVPMVAFALSSVVAPFLAKKIGLINTLTLASVLLTVGLVVRVGWLSPSYFLFGTVVLSVAISLGNVLVPAVIKRYAPTQIGKTTGIYAITLSLFAGVSALIATPMSDALGWQVFLGVWAVVSLLAMVCWAWFGHLVKALPTLSKSPIQTTPSVSVWRSSLAWWISLLMGIQSLLYYSLAGFLPLLLMARGISAQTAGMTVFVLQAVAVPTNLVLARLVANGTNLRPLAMMGAVFNVIGVVGFGFGSLLGVWLWVWALLTGVGCSILFSLCLMMFGLKSSHDSQTSALSGMAQAVGYGIAFVGPMMIGMLLQWKGSFDVPWAILAVLMVINCIMAYLATADRML